MQWTRRACNRDPAEPFGDLAGLAPSVPWQAPAGPVPPYPVASNQRDARPPTAERGARAENPNRSDLNGFPPDAAALRAAIRRLILEELSQLAGG